MPYILTLCIGSAFKEICSERPKHLSLSTSWLKGGETCVRTDFVKKKEDGHGRRISVQYFPLARTVTPHSLTPENGPLPCQFALVFGDPAP